MRSIWDDCRPGLTGSDSHCADKPGLVGRPPAFVKRHSRRGRRNRRTAGTELFAQVSKEACLSARGTDRDGTDLRLSDVALFRSGHRGRPGASGCRASRRGRPCAGASHERSYGRWLGDAGGICAASLGGREGLTSICPVHCMPRRRSSIQAGRSSGQLTSTTEACSSIRSWFWSHMTASWQGSCRRNICKIFRMPAKSLFGLGIPAAGAREVSR